MKLNCWMCVALAAVLVGWLTLGSTTSPGQAPVEKPAVVWEYQTVRGPWDGALQIDEMLNKLGQHGWELVLTTEFPAFVASGNGYSAMKGWVFKRAKK